MKFKEHYKSKSIDFSVADGNKVRCKKDFDKEKWDFPANNKSERTKGIYYSTNFSFNDLNESYEEKIINNDLEVWNSIIFIDIEEEKEDNEKKEIKKIDEFVCFKIMGEKLRFKDLFELLNGEMISDLVIFN